MRKTNVRIAINLRAASAETRLFCGREHLVAPMTLIVPGVLNGSRGPLFYPEDELKRTASAWNNTPIVVYHPSADGSAVSARSPDVLERSHVGNVFRAEYRDGKLTAEGWFDVERLRKVDPRILSNLRSGVPIELSTGLVTEEDATAGVYNGVEYKAVARNYQPDHLAILPDEVGACSLRDGCGVLVNRDLVLVNEQGESEAPSIVANKSYGDVSADLRTQLQGDRFTSGAENEKPASLVEVFEDGFVYSQNGKLWRLPYEVQDEVLTILEAKPEQVQLYRRVAAVGDEPNVGQVIPDETEIDIMADDAKKDLIDNLIQGCECWEEKDREVLNSLPEKKLKGMVTVMNAAKKPEPKPEPVVNKEEPEPAPEPKPKTADDWFNEAPPEVRRVVNSALAWEQQQKDECIKAITSNERNTLTEDRLKAMDLDSLRAIAAMAGPVAEPTDNRRPIFSGANAPASTPSRPVEEPLMVPTINWAENN